MQNIIRIWIYRTSGILVTRTSKRNMRGNKRRVGRLPFEMGWMRKAVLEQLHWGRDVNSKPRGTVSRESSWERTGQEFWGGEGGPSSRSVSEGRIGGNVTEVSATSLCASLWTRTRTLLFFLSNIRIHWLFFSKRELQSDMCCLWKSSKFVQPLT